MTRIDQLFSRINDLAKTIGDALQLRGFKPGGTVGQVPVKTSSSDFAWQWSSISGSGTVTSVSVVTANGVSGAVATSTSTPSITLTLGAITPTSVTATGDVTGANLSGTNTGDQDLSGYAPIDGALGTPSSGTLTNCTGLPIAGGGTGATTAADARTNLGLGAASDVTFGLVTTGAGTTANVALKIGGFANTGLINVNNETTAVVAAGTKVAAFYSGGLYMSNSQFLGFSDGRIYRKSAGVLTLGTSTSDSSYSLFLSNLTASGTVTGANLVLAPSSSVTPENNGNLVIEATSDTSVTIKLKGSDGTVRSVVLTLAP